MTLLNPEAKQAEPQTQNNSDAMMSQQNIDPTLSQKNIETP